MELWLRTWAILWKDILIEVRTKGTFNAMAFFAALILFIFSFAIGPDAALLRTLAAGLLWVGITFTGLLALARTYHSEELAGGLEALLLYPGEPRAIFLGKLVGNLAVLLLVEAILYPVAAVLFHMDLTGRILPVAGVAALGTLGFSVVGTFYAALTLHLRAREVMLPLLVLPLLIPVLLGAVSATGALLDPAASGGVAGWVRLLVAFDVLYFVVCTWTFPVLLER
jgi:heme exporter protein B